MVYKVSISLCMPQRAFDDLFVSFQQALVGRYSLERELGRGGMGIVYLAHEVRLDRPVAIKLLPPEFAANAVLRERFLHEARTAARLSHPYIVPTYSVDEIGGFVFYVMAFVDGETLAERVRAHGPLKPADVMRMMRDVAWALAYAHAQGVVHRDIKAANVMLERGGERAMVLDFGIARVTSVQGHTAVGELVGTPEYMSPEQACGEPVDGRSDLYSLGVVGYFALTGTLPFTGSAQKVLAQQVTKPAPAMASVSRGTPRALAAAIDTCLAKDAAKRFATGEALAEALDSSLEKRTELPIPLRVFLDRRRMIQLIAPPAAGVAMLGSLLATMERGGVASTTRIAAVAVLGAVIIVGPIAVFIRRLRQVLRHGFGPEDIAAALDSLHERRHEEFIYDHGPTPSTRERVLRLMGIGGMTVGVAALIVLATGAGGLPKTVLFPVIFSGAYLGAAGLIVSGKWRRLRNSTESRFARFWRGRVGHAFARLAGYKLGQRAIQADRHTELGIAMSAEALYAGFSKPQRKALGDVPAVLHSLEAHARAMRARIAHLDASLQVAQATPARTLTAGEMQERLMVDLRAARAKAEQRLNDVVTSLETLRLDLLRLHADGGVGSAESITQNLSSARALGDDVDRLLASGGEVERLLAQQP